MTSFGGDALVCWLQGENLSDGTKKKKRNQSEARKLRTGRKWKNGAERKKGKLTKEYSKQGL
jgi:hypothetical protein